VKTYFECLPCVIRQSLEGVSRVTDDEAVREEVLRRVLRELVGVDFREPSPVIIGKAHRIIREVTGADDPYGTAKETCNRNALNLYPLMKQKIEGSANGLETALRLAIAGNTIDFIVDPDADRSNMLLAVEESLSAPIPPEVLTTFETAVMKARTILYLGDNAGEIVFDRLLVEQLPAEKITYVVKGSAVVNDVTRVDAESTGMADLVEVVDNGSDMPGTVLDHCSAHFQSRFQRADLVIAKGQGNYESLTEIEKSAFFLFKAKCSVVADHLGCEIGKLILTAQGFQQTVLNTSDRNSVRPKRSL
jgi:damage-control phosphatase, subfamily I